MADIDSLREPLRSIVKQIIAESGGRVTVSSGYRTNAEQVALYNAYRAGKGNLAAKPGTSLHEHGMAVDFGGDLNLAQQLGRKYGLIFNVNGEPWHGTLGSNVNFDGDPDFEGAYGIQYNLNYTGEGQAASPEAVLANRVMSITRMLGQNMSGVPGPGSIYDDEILAGTDPYTSVQNPTPTMDTTQFIPQDMSNQGSVASATGAAALSGGSAGQLQQFAQSIFGEYGFDPSELGALITLWNKESNWNPAAANPHSTARGIAQKMTSIHGPIESNPQDQIRWGLNYIRDRYGSPSNALAFHLRNNWY